MNANGLMELSPVIAPLSQAFIKCERGWLLCAFCTWNTGNSLPRSSFLVPSTSCTPRTLQAKPKPLWRTPYKFWRRACLTSACLASHAPSDLGRRRQTDGRSDFNSSKVGAANHFVTSKSMSNQVHFIPLSHSWLQYKKQNKTRQSASAKNHGALLPIGFIFFWGGRIFIPPFLF